MKRQIIIFGCNHLSKIVYQVDCEWGDWVVGECSITCGGGTRSNTREIKIDAAFGGRQCPGLASITEACNVQECPGSLFFIVFSFDNS